METHKSIKVSGALILLSLIIIGAFTMGTVSIFFGSKDAKCFQDEAVANGHAEYIQVENHKVFKWKELK